MAKRKISRFHADGLPANRHAKRELGERVEDFGEVGAIFKRSYRREPIFMGRVLIGESVRYFPLEMLGEPAIRDLAERAGLTLKDERLEKVLDFLYADLQRRAA